MSKPETYTGQPGETLAEIVADLPENTVQLNAFRQGNIWRVAFICEWPKGAA